MSNPREIDEDFTTHFDALRGHVADLSHQIEDGARQHAIWRRRVTEGGAAPAEDAPPLNTIDGMCALVETALQRSTLVTDDPTVQIEATLTTKIVRTDKESVGLKFVICGVRGGGGVQRTSGNTQSVTVTFVPRPATTPSPDAGPTGASEPDDGSELSAELKALGEMIGLKALRWEEATIELDFAFDDQGKASVIAAGDVRDNSTHHLEIKLTRHGEKSKQQTSAVTTAAAPSTS